jgi:hypothetical protein
MKMTGRREVDGANKKDCNRNNTNNSNLPEKYPEMEGPTREIESLESLKKWT